MTERLPAHLLELVYDALLKSFWTKKALRQFLRRSAIPASLLSQLQEGESKRDWLDYLFPTLEDSDRGMATIKSMATALAEQNAFPDLERWEDSVIKIREARVAVSRLNAYLTKKVEERAAEETARARREEAERRKLAASRASHDLQKLKLRLEELANSIGTQAAGYSFQDWFYDFMEFSEIEHRRPFVHGGRQIDGSVTIDGTTYLVELKFTSNQTSAPDVDSLLSKVNNKSDNTMGVMISMSGYSEPAVNAASFAKSPLLLLSHEHVFSILIGAIGFSDVVRRVRRHSSQTGEAFLSMARFGSG